MTRTPSRIPILVLYKVAFFLAAAFLLAPTFSARAHPSRSSAVMLDFHRDGVAAEVTLPVAELPSDFPQPLTNDSAPKEYILARVNPLSQDGRPWSVSVRSLELQTNNGPSDFVAQLWMQPPPGASVRKFTFNYSALLDNTSTHNVFVFVRNDWDTAVFSGQPEPLGNLHFPITSLSIDRSHGSWWRGFDTVFNLGLHHIAEGTDHLLFLLALLLPAPLLLNGKRWGRYGGLKRTLLQLLKIVSAFTIGHSLTLILGALGWVRLPVRPVEILIAISIFVSALHAIRPFFAGREVWIAAGFGLVHGLAFAAGIAEYGFSPWSLASTILGFNLGIETMQLAVVAAVVPWLILIARTRFYSPVRIEGAAFAAIASLGWIAQRAFNLPNPFDPIVNFLAAHPFWIIAALAATALLANAWEWARQRNAGVAACP